MKELRYTLLSDGSSDQALIPILRWLLLDNGVSLAIQAEWADLRQLPSPPVELAAKIEKSLDLFSCDLLFVHRDAENQPYEMRVTQIRDAVAQVSEKMNTLPPAICVVPVRMQEAWLLIDEMAIRRAAGNSNGRRSISLPSLRQLEEIPDPKEILYNLLKEASGRSGRRLKQFKPYQYARLVAESIQDFSCLRRLSAFAQLDEEIRELVEIEGWNKNAS